MSQKSNEEVFVDPYDQSSNQNLSFNQASNTSSAAYMKPQTQQNPYVDQRVNQVSMEQSPYFEVSH